MRKSKLLLIFVGIFISTLTFAQVNLGLKVGANLNNMMFDVDNDYGDETETKTKLGFQVGLIADIPIVENQISVQPGLIFNNKGYTMDIEKIFEDEGYDVDDYEGYARLNYNYLEVPINVVYKTNGFQVSAGPYIALGVGGNFKHDFSMEIDGVDIDSDDVYDEDSYKLEAVFGTVDDDRYEDYLDDDDVIELYRGLDLGLNLCVGYQVGNILLNVGYSVGLSNLTPNYDADNYGLDEDIAENVIQKNRVITFSASFFFN